MNSKQPYFAVIFTSKRSSHDNVGYEDMAQKMALLAEKQSGYLGMDSVREASGKGITVSYWSSLEDISTWKKNVEHLEAQSLGKQKWYDEYHIRICKVEREYGS